MAASVPHRGGLLRQISPAEIVTWTAGVESVLASAEREFDNTLYA
jgi:hypothetical protein